MAIYAIGDLHLSVAAKKPMDIFAGWDNYAERMMNNWKAKIQPEDIVILAGDTSWGMTMHEAMPDFQLIHNLPGRKKIILKGNHDYWWTSLSKMMHAFAAHGLDSLFFLHNNSYYEEGIHICGSRGWIFENGQPHDDKLIRREAIRIEASLKARSKAPGKTALFLHYPPAYADQALDEYFQLMYDYGVERCYYGHIHGPGHKHAVQGMFRGIGLQMLSADYIAFDPVLIKANEA